MLRNAIVPLQYSSKKQTTVWGGCIPRSGEIKQNGEQKTDRSREGLPIKIQMDTASTVRLFHSRFQAETRQTDREDENCEVFLLPKFIMDQGCEGDKTRLPAPIENLFQLFLRSGTGDFPGKKIFCFQLLTIFYFCCIIK